MKFRKIGLDIDEVCANWLGGYTKRYGITGDILTYDFDPLLPMRLDELRTDKEFWLDLEPLFNPRNLQFVPHAYITARSIPKEWTEEWLKKHNFPDSPVYSVGFGGCKIEAAKKSGIDVFVDDHYKNFITLNNAGIETYLFNTTHNQQFDVGDKRIKNLVDFTVLS